MSNLAAIQFLAGLLLASWAAWRIDIYDDVHGIRPGGYGSNISYVWPYSPLAAIGFLAALLAPVTLIVGGQ